LDRNITAAIRIPTISVLGDIFASASAGDIYVIENHIGGVGNKVVVLG